MLLIWSHAEESDGQQIWYCTALHPERKWRLLWDADGTFLGNNVSFSVPPTNTDLSKDLIAFYRLNGNGVDQTTNGHHGIVYGAIASSNRYGESNMAMYFDQHDDYIDLNLALLETSHAEHEMTLTAWIYPENVVDDRFMITQYVEDPHDYGRFTWGLNGGRIRYFRGGAAVFSNTDLVPNQWYHVATTKDSLGNITHYINGQPDGTGSLQGAFSSVSTRIGGGIFWSISYVFSGVIDDLRVFRRALSADEIQRLWQCK